ncbi:MAG: Mut7-C RNAse domain-containing protein [Candidatus Bathyarchaeia archaeon]
MVSVPQQSATAIAVRLIQQTYAPSMASSYARIAEPRRRKNKHRVNNSNPEMKPRFLLDGMLGSLSRWLRMGSYDTEYKRDTPDDDLIESARRDGRILLTRDEALVNRARKRGVEAIYIENEDDKGALRQIAKEFELEYDPTQARCPKCNNTVDKVRKDQVNDKVPEGTLKVIDEYWICPRCGSIYWRGSHWSRIVETLTGTSEF